MTGNDISRQDFADRVGERFSMPRPAGEQVELTLTECTDLGPEQDSASFSLTFTAGPDAPIEQASYLLSADGFPAAPIFLVPVRQLPDGVEYQAVFNMSSPTQRRMRAPHE